MPGLTGLELVGGLVAIVLVALGIAVHERGKRKAAEQELTCDRLDREKQRQVEQQLAKPAEPQKVAGKMRARAARSQPRVRKSRKN
jgi:uncharacterized membrane protein YebE (DUF533 family)